MKHFNNAVTVRSGSFSTMGTAGVPTRSLLEMTPGCRYEGEYRKEQWSDINV